MFFIQLIAPIYEYLWVLPALCFAGAGALVVIHRRRQI